MQKKSKLTALAALGLVACSMASAEAQEQQQQSAQTCTPIKPADKNKLLSQLDNAHANMFNSMDCEGQNLAMQLAQQSCKGKNSCKGLNSCKNNKHACAGLGACKGTSPGPFKDKNKAIEVASKHMAEKRQKSMGGM